MTEEKKTRGTSKAELEKETQTDPSPPECFVIMPISDQPNYDAGHFTRVYRDIIKPACITSGLKPHRADEDAATNMIQHSILLSLLNAPVAICDLSSRNPNVMFELGLRQAFDKPVIIIQDEKTPQIFDISILRYTSYRSSLLYSEVLEDQNRLVNAINTTMAEYRKGSSTNSLMKLLSIQKAALDNPTKEDVQSIVLSNIQNQLSFLTSKMNQLTGETISKPQLPRTTVQRNIQLTIDELTLIDIARKANVEIEDLISDLPTGYNQLAKSRLISNNFRVVIYSDDKNGIWEGYTKHIGRLVNKLSSDLPTES